MSVLHDQTCICGHDRDAHGSDGAGHCGASKHCRSVDGCKAFKAVPLSPWRPETDPVRCAILGKLSEELNEAGAIAARCSIQGIEESEPVTLKPNRQALQEELADVLAGIGIAVEAFGLDADAMSQRTKRKRGHLLKWHAMIREMQR